ncbi:hypothetical protein MRX96_002924 [Rhipicephalus microplus]
MRPPYWKTKFYDDPADRQFALRMIGWINWTTTRCEEYSGWACGGRGIEASSLAISETAETAAQDYAMEYAVELIERARAMNTKEPDEDVKTETSDYDFNNMAKCVPGLQKSYDIQLLTQVNGTCKGSVDLDMFCSRTYISANAQGWKTKA